MSVEYVPTGPATWPGNFSSATAAFGVKAWLQSVGLAFHPFVPLEAGQDPRLSTYLVGHDAFATLWGDWPALLFAPAGGGKSAFRVRLAYACRAGEDGRRIFAIVYHLPHRPLSYAAHLHTICRAAAHELLLELAWRPGWFEALDKTARQEIRRALDWNAPGLLGHFLPQLRAEGSPLPIVMAFDPSAAYLPNPPAPARVRALCDALQALAVATEAPPSPEERFSHLLRVTFSVLKRQALYLLVDSVDAHSDTLHAPATALEWLRPLTARFSSWEQQRLFPKLFLPGEYDNFLDRERLTWQTKSTKIVWTPELLVGMLQARVRAASGGEFDSLDAISSPALQRVEELLAAQVRPNPRELLVLTGRVLLEHVRRAGSLGLLEPQDLEAATSAYANRGREP